MAFYAIDGRPVVDPTGMTARGSRILSACGSRVAGWRFGGPMNGNGCSMARRRAACRIRVVVPQRAASYDRTRRSQACSLKRNVLRFSWLRDRSYQSRGSCLRSVDVASVFDGHDQDRMIRFVDSVQDPVVSSTGAVKAFEFESKGAANARWILGERTVNELDRSQSNLLRDSRQRASGGRRPVDLIRLIRRIQVRLVSAIASAFVRRSVVPVRASVNASRTSARRSGRDITLRVSSSDSRSSALSRTAAGRPCFVMTTRPCSRSMPSTTSESRFLTSASDSRSGIMAISIATLSPSHFRRNARTAYAKAGVADARACCRINPRPTTPGRVPDGPVGSTARWLHGWVILQVLERQVRPASELERLVSWNRRRQFGVSRPTRPALSAEAVGEEATVRSVEASKIRVHAVL